MQKKHLLIVFGVAIILLLCSAFFFESNKYSISTDTQYQAIFLDSGQVYFGYIDKTSEGWIVLKNVYYLKEKERLQDQQSDKQAKDLSLVKLGDELHEPTNKMTINLNHILFIEDLSDDSKVTKAIEQHKNK
jgi:hypothetical protein